MFSTTTCGSSASPAPYAPSSRSTTWNCSAGSPAAASMTWTSMRARSRCARNSWPEPDAFAGALDQAGNVGNRQLAAVGRVDGSEDRLERGERVLGDLRPRVGDAPQKRGLARVGQSGQRCVRHQLEPELERPLLTWQPGLGKARRLPRRRREPLVPTAPRATFGDDGTRPRPGQVGQDRPLLVEDLRADRDAQLDRLPRRRRSCSRPARGRRGRHG